MARTYTAITIDPAVVRREIDKTIEALGEYRELAELSAGALGVVLRRLQLLGDMLELCDKEGVEVGNDTLRAVLSGELD